MDRELIAKWEVVSKLITLQNNYNFFKNEWDAERLYREIAKLELEIGKTPAIATDNNVGHKWIPVTERLPEKDVLVLCVGARGGMFIGYPRWVYEDEKVAYTCVPNSRHGRQTKYWMPLPEPPKEETL